MARRKVLEMSRAHTDLTARLLKADNGEIASDVSSVQKLLAECSFHWSNRLFLPWQHAEKHSSLTCTSVWS